MMVNKEKKHFANVHNGNDILCVDANIKFIVRNKMSVGITSTTFCIVVPLAIKYLKTKLFSFHYCVELGLNFGRYSMRKMSSFNI